MSNAIVVEGNPGNTLDPVFVASLMGETPKREFEVVTLDRAAVEQALDRLAGDMPVAQRSESLHTLIIHLQESLACESPELWAVYSPGPGSCYPMLDKENAERVRQSMISRFEELSVKENWSLKTFVVEVIPSPFHPLEHFQLLAQELDGEEKRLRQLAKEYREQRDELVAAAAILLKESHATPAALAVRALLDKPGMVSA